MCRALRNLVRKLSRCRSMDLGRDGRNRQSLRCARKPRSYIGGSIRSGVTRKELQDYLAKNKGTIKGKVRGLFAVCGNGEKPVGPPQKASYIDNHLAKLCEVNGLPSKVFNGRITKSLLDPDDRKRMEDMYPKFAGKPLEDYDLLKRADCLAFGKEVLAGIK
jgi:menaquinone-dependent protoporphyrinogen IX oxidase